MPNGFLTVFQPDLKARIFELRRNKFWLITKEKIGTPLNNYNTYTIKCSFQNKGREKEIKGMQVHTAGDFQSLSQTIDFSDILIMSIFGESLFDDMFPFDDSFFRHKKNPLYGKNA